MLLTIVSTILFSYWSFPFFQSGISTLIQNCTAPKQIDQLLSTFLSIIGLNCCSVQFCLLLGEIGVEIEMWSINTSDWGAYLKKIRYLKEVDNQACEVFCCTYLTSFIELILIPDQDHLGNLWEKSSNSFSLSLFYLRLHEGYGLLYDFLWHFREWIIQICTDWHYSHWDSPQSGNTACAVQGGTLAGAGAEEERSSAVTCLWKNFCSP